MSIFRSPLNKKWNKKYQRFRGKIVPHIPCNSGSWEPVREKNKYKINRLWYAQVNHVFFKLPYDFSYHMKPPTCGNKILTIWWWLLYMVMTHNRLYFIKSCNKVVWVLYGVMESHLKNIARDNLKKARPCPFIHILSLFYPD